MSNTKLYYHIIWRTYRSLPTIPEESKAIMFKYILMMCKTYGWYLRRINAYLDHVHMLIELKPSDNVANVVQQIKGATSAAFSETKEFPMFEGWNKGYGAFTVGFRETPQVLDYIKNQEVHHKKLSTQEELHKLLIEYGFEERGYEDW